MRASALRGLTSCLARGAGPPHLIPRGPRPPPSPKKGEGWGGDRDPLPTAVRSTSPFQGEVKRVSGAISANRTACVRAQSLEKFRRGAARGGEHEQHEILVAGFLEPVLFPARHIDDIAGLHLARVDRAGGVLDPSRAGP